MSKNTTDELREQIQSCFKRNLMQTEGDTELFDTELTIDNLLALISNREKLARLEEVGFAYDLMQGLLLENDDSDFVCTEFQRQARSRMSELAALRKELDGDSV